MSERRSFGIFSAALGVFGIEALGGVAEKLDTLLQTAFGKLASEVLEEVKGRVAAYGELPPNHELERTLRLAELTSSLLLVLQWQREWRLEFGTERGMLEPAFFKAATAWLHGQIGLCPSMELQMDRVLVRRMEATLDALLRSGDPAAESRAKVSAAAGDVWDELAKGAGSNPDEYRARFLSTETEPPGWAMVFRAFMREALTGKPRVLDAFLIGRLAALTEDSATLQPLMRSLVGNVAAMQEAQARIETSQSRIETIVQTLPDAVITKFSLNVCSMQTNITKARSALEAIRAIKESYFWYDLYEVSRWETASFEIKCVLDHARRDTSFITGEEYYKFATILLELSWISPNLRADNETARKFYEFIQERQPDIESDAHKHLYLHNAILHSGHRALSGLRNKPLPQGDEDISDRDIEQTNEALRVLNGASEGIEGWSESIQAMKSYQYTSIIKANLYRRGYVFDKEMDMLAGLQKDISTTVNGFSKEILATNLAIATMKGQKNNLINLLISEREKLRNAVGPEKEIIAYALNINLLSLGEKDNVAHCSLLNFQKLNVTQKLRFMRIARIYLLPEALGFVRDALSHDDLKEAPEFLSFIAKLQH